jgi:CopA family copper-resistance protein
VDSSIHWHGLIIPADMDGVPGLSFPGIKPQETFTYRIPVRQNGTYWYHSHSGLQEQTGIYGPLIIDAAAPEPFRYDREYVVMLSDWTFEDPHEILAHLKKYGGYYNFQRPTLGEFFGDVSERGLGVALKDRLAWGKMRMDPTDIADITGYTYTYLCNGMPPQSNWTGLFKRGERVRLRFINGSAASYFDVRIPGLEMTVVQADGQYVKPVEVDEFRMAIAETYDVIVQPTEDRAYTIFAESMDRSGYARGTLAPREGMAAPIPARRPRPMRTMADMGMAHDMSTMDMEAADIKGKPAAEQKQPMAGMDHSMHHMPMEATAPSSSPVPHAPDHHGPGNSGVAMMSQSRLHEPGIGLEGSDRRILTYADLKSVRPQHYSKEPDREIELHLTGNMERYMWSFDGKMYAEVKATIQLKYGEWVRFTLVNDTMMEHPIHLHGMWSILDTGSGMSNPRKHTLNVKPAERISFLVHADALGKWAFHCHILYHMEMGMFRVVEVVEVVDAKAMEGSL